MSARWYRVEWPAAPRGHALEGRARGTTWRTWERTDGRWAVIDTLDPQRESVVGSLTEARDLAENGKPRARNPQAIHMRQRNEHGRAAVHRREMRKAQEAARRARTPQDRADALALAEHHRRQLEQFGAVENPRGKQWFVAAVQGPGLWPVGPVLVVDRHEAGRLSQIGGGRGSERGKPKADILLAGFDSHAKAEAFARDVNDMQVEISQPDGTVVYRGTVLGVAHDRLTHQLGFVDQGRLLGILAQPEVTMGKGKRTLIVRRADAANNPESNDDIVARAADELDLAYGQLEKARDHKESGRSGQAYVGYVQAAARSFQNALRTAQDATGRKARQIERDANAELDELLSEFREVPVSLLNPSPNPSSRDAAKARRIANPGA